MAAGMLQAAEKGRKGETYILSGWKVSSLEMLQTIRRVTGRSFAQIKLPFKLAWLIAQLTPHYYRMAKVKPRLTPYALETLVSNSNISRAKAERELGYTVRPHAETLQDAIAWFKNNTVASVFR